MQPPDYDAFFRNYVDVFNRSTAGGVDADAIRASYAEYFVVGRCGRRRCRVVPTTTNMPRCCARAPASTRRSGFRA